MPIISVFSALMKVYSMHLNIEMMELLLTTFFGMIIILQIVCNMRIILQTLTVLFKT